MPRVWKTLSSAQRDWPNAQIGQMRLTLSEGDSRNGVKMKCVYCDKEFADGADRRPIRYHLAGDSKSSHIGRCSAAPGSVVESFRRKIDEKELGAKQKQKILKLDVATSSVLPVPASTAQGTISGLFKAQTGGKEPADRAIARLFYANAIPFNVADSKYFKEAVKAVAACGPTHIPPGKLLILLSLR